MVLDRRRGAGHNGAVKRRTLLILGLVVFAAGYFVLDVRQRARIDRKPTQHRTDFTVYQYAARHLVHGDDPYEARNPRGYRYVYPPLLAVLLMPVADWSPPEAALVFYLLCFGSFVGALWLLARFRLRAGGPALGWAGVAVATVVCLGFAHQGFQRGQVTPWLLAMQVAALVALRARRPLAAGALLGFAGALRLTPLLPAGAVGLGLLVAGLAGRGHGAWLRYAGGVLLGLVVGFGVVPVVALGPQRAEAVTRRWLEVTEQVYADQVDLGEEYRINEWRFKNQAPRRVYATWLGWARGVPFEKEQPLFEGEGDRTLVDGAAEVTAWALLLLAALLGAWFLRDPQRPAFAVTYAAIVLLPALMTRYTWPTHYLMALPALALAASTAPWRRFGIRVGPAVLVLLFGTLCFYAAHARALQVLGEAGCLMLACAVFLGLFLVRGLRERQA